MSADLDEIGDKDKIVSDFFNIVREEEESKNEIKTPDYNDRNSDKFQSIDLGSEKPQSYSNDDTKINDIEKMDDEKKSSKSLQEEEMNRANEIINEPIKSEEKDEKGKGVWKTICFNISNISMSCGKYRCLIGSMPCPCINPHFKEIVNNSQRKFLLYLNVFDFIFTYLIFLLNFFCICYYMIISTSFPGSSKVGGIGVTGYKIFEFVLSLFLPTFYLVFGSVRYLCCFYACAHPDVKKRLKYWKIYFIIAGIFVLFLLFESTGLMGSLGIVKTVKVGKVMFKWFFPIILFVITIIFIVLWIMSALINIIIIIGGIMRMRRDIDDAANQGDGKGVVFFKDIAFVFKD